MRLRGRALLTVGIATLGIVAVSVFGAAQGPAGPAGPGPKASDMVALPLGAVPGGTLAGSISALQGHLRDQPKDAAAWSALGLAYIDQARTTADPARYPQAEQVLRRSLAEQPVDNDGAHAGLAALAAARHDFAGALREADASLAINSYDAGALAVRIDALVETGRYAEAADAVTVADERRPGIPVFARAAYVFELRGDVARARQVLTDTLASATAPGDIAYVASALGDLAWSRGDYGAAQTSYAEALRADPAFSPALFGRGRTRAAQGDLSGALADLKTVTQRLPLPAYLAALGDVEEASGDRVAARQASDVTGAWIALAKANGVATDLDTALVAADHGDPAAALAAARAEWSRRHSVQVADALAWALHANGRDAEALDYARQANGVGYRNAQYLFHLGVIEAGVAQRADAARDLRAALDLNPGFSSGEAARATALLKEWGSGR